MSNSSFTGFDPIVSQLPANWSAVMGWRNGWLVETKFGENTSTGTSLEEVWNQGGFESYLTSAETMNIASTSTNDDGSPAGTGARTLTIYGLDNDYNLINETVTLNGTTNVTTSNSYLRVHRMVVNTAGSLGWNAGTITATASSSSSVHGQISVNQNQTTKTQYTTPAGYYAMITYIELSCGRGDNAQFQARLRPQNEVFQLKKKVDIDDSALVTNFDTPFIVPPKTDMAWWAKSNGAGNVFVTAAYSFFLIPSGQVNV